MGCIRICGLVYARAFLCEFVHVCMCSGRLEIKTLCGTWLMIRRELKQKADENTGGGNGEGRGEKGKWGEQEEEKCIV